MNFHKLHKNPKFGVEEKKKMRKSCELQKIKEKRMLVVPKEELSIDITSLLDPFMSFYFPYHDFLMLMHIRYTLSSIWPITL